jgi:hypothetical protein
MPFQISELVIRVSGDSTDGVVADQGVTECKGGKTCGGQTPTECRHGGTTCMHPVVTHCGHGGSTCPDTTNCRHGGSTCSDTTNCRHGGSTCATPGKSKAQVKDAELDFVLQQIRDAVSAQKDEKEELVTA